VIRHVPANVHQLLLGDGEVGIDGIQALDDEEL
jgi:hypothetical protein